MDYSTGLLAELERFAFVAEALDASGGFKPSISWAIDSEMLRKPSGITGPCHLVPYPREGMAKFAARAAVAVYENHLGAACGKFVGYLAKKPPMRQGADGPLTSAFLADADQCGNALDVFWQSFMVEAKARGSMLLLVDMPSELPKTLAEQVASRRIPYLTAIRPERLRGYELDANGRFSRVGIGATERIDGKQVAVIREWDAVGWRVLHNDGREIRSGTHGLGRCPVLAFTERGTFPCFGDFEQIAPLSCRVFNAQSELDEILRGQTFSLLTYQVPEQLASTFDGTKVAAAIGTHNMLIHSGDAPAFIAPADGPATKYMERIAGLEAAIRRISLEIEDSAAQAAEAGIAKQIRFQALNSALVKFATRMQDFERQVWDLFAKAVGQENRVEVSWPLDYTLADTQAELDKLTAMQATGFPDAVLTEKRKQIVSVEFAGVETEVMDALLDAIDEPAKEIEPEPPGTDGGESPDEEPDDEDAAA